MTTTHLEKAVHPDHHPHRCEHGAVPHDDHVDSVHDGHRHVAHDGHCDDH